MTKHKPVGAAKPTFSAKTAFVRYARHLRSSSPRIPVTQELLSILNELVRDLRDGNELQTLFGYWVEIVDGLVGAETVGAPTCGRALLSLAGYLGDALLEFGEQVVPLGIVVALGIAIDCDPLVFRYAQEGDRVWLETTEQGAAILGGAAKFDLPKMPEGDGPPEILASLLGSNMNLDED